VYAPAVSDIALETLSIGFGAPPPNFDAFYNYFSIYLACFLLLLLLPLSP
jgi:hypothetical protein